MNHDYAVAWAQAITEDTDSLLSLYADEAIAEHRAVNDHMTDTITERSDLRNAYTPFANADPASGLGIHTFRADEYLGDERHGLIMWSWSVEHLDRFHGIPVPDGKLEAEGHTFQVYDADGKIVQESTQWNPVPALQELGVPIQKPHYWDADFDPASLLAS
jgi:steroid delta-isomerase-like uncharacterized protein